MKSLISLTLFLLFSSCASSPERPEKHPQKPSAKIRTKAPTSPSPKREEPKPQAKAASPASSVGDFLAKNREIITGLGTQASEEQIRSLKQYLAALSRIPAAKMAILTNPTNGSGWFGKTIVLVNKETGEAYFADNTGRHFSAKLKDRVLGGTFPDSRGDTHLITIFYGELQDPIPYRFYLDGEPVKPKTFSASTEKEKSIRAELRDPFGAPLIVTGNRQDGASLQVNGKNALPLFQ